MLLPRPPDLVTSDNSLPCPKKKYSATVNTDTAGNQDCPPTNQLSNTEAISYGRSEAADHLMESINRVAAGGGDIDSPDVLVARRRTELYTAPAPQAIDAMDNRKVYKIQMAGKRKTIDNSEASNTIPCVLPSVSQRKNESIEARYGQDMDKIFTFATNDEHRLQITAFEAKKLDQVKNHRLLSLTDEEREYLRNRNDIFNPTSVRPKFISVVNSRPLPTTHGPHTAAQSPANNPIHPPPAVHPVTERSPDTPVPALKTSASTQKSPVVKMTRLDGFLQQSLARMSPTGTRSESLERKRVFYVLSTKEVEAAKSSKINGASIGPVTAANEGGLSSTKIRKVTPFTVQPGVPVNSQPDKVNSVVKDKPSYSPQYTVKELINMKKSGNALTKLSSSAHAGLDQATLNQLKNKGLIIKLQDYFGDMKTDRGKQSLQGLSLPSSLPSTQSAMRKLGPGEVVIKKGDSTAGLGHLNSPDIKKATIEAIKKMTFKASEDSNTGLHVPFDRSHLTVKIGHTPYVEQKVGTVEQQCKKRKTLPAPKPKDCITSSYSKKKKKRVSMKFKTHDVQKLMRRAFGKSRDPCLRLAVHLNLMPVTAISSCPKQPSDLSPVEACPDSESQLTRATVTKCANIVQLYKHADGKCAYSNLSVAVTLNSIPEVEGRGVHELAGNRAVIHFTEDGLINTIETSTFEPGVYVVEHTMAHNQGRSVTAALTPYPPHLDMIPDCSLAMVVKNVLDSVAGLGTDVQSVYEETSVGDFTALSCFSPLQQKKELNSLDKKYAHITDRSDSPKVQSAMFYSEGMRNYFNKMYTNGEDGSASVGSMRRQNKDGVAVGLCRFSERASALKMRQNELMESCRKLSVSGRLAGDALPDVIDDDSGEDTDVSIDGSI